MITILVGAALTLLGLAGGVVACQADAQDRDLVVAGLSGLALAIGICCMALGAARHGYHRRPLGSPPGDMDPDKAHDPKPGNLL